MKLKYYKLTIIEFAIVLLSILFILNWYLRSYSSIWSYVDELLEIIIISLAIFKLLSKHNKTKELIIEEKILIANSIFLIFIGLIGNLLSNYQSSLYAMVVDLIGWQRFFAIYSSALYILKDENINKYKWIISNVAKAYVVFFLIFYVLNVVGVLHLITTVDRETNLLVFTIMGHPSSAAALTAVAISILFIEPKKNIIYIIIGVILELLTLRAKSFGFVAMIFYLLIFSKDKISIKKILIAAIILFCIAYEDISFYFFNSEASRAILLTTSFTIAKDFLPFGAGFATFGSVMSTAYYSKAYYAYDLYWRYGFSPQNSLFVGDGGWATIIAQFGFIGFILIIINVILVYKSYKKRTCNKKINVIPIAGILGYAIISSTNEVFFNSDVAVIFALTLAILIKYYEHSNGTKVDGKKLIDHEQYINMEGMKK